MKAVTPSLDRLVGLRGRELDRMAAEMAEHHVLRGRYLGNIERLQGLCKTEDGVAPGRRERFMPALSANGALFRESLQRLAQAHHAELLRHEAQMALAQRSLHAAARSHEALRLLAERQRVGLRRSEAEHEQHQQDELAAQCWLRTR